MPLYEDVKKVLVLGSGPIVIGQAAEFDYAGTQACRALCEEGLEVILVNSNPATIMTDKKMAHKIYIEPMTIDVMEHIISIEKPDSLLPNLGGQTGLNLAMELYESGFLAKHSVRLLGAKHDTIEKAEDRQIFKDTMGKIGQPCVASEVVTTVEGAENFADKIGLPVIIRPAYTLGGTGGGIAYTKDELLHIAKNGIEASRVGQILVERCIAGWKEIEYETIRDSRGNAIVVCNMENIDPVGVHTGDSIVVAPCQTLGGIESVMLRDAALSIIEELSIEGGCNVQFALNPDSLEYAVIEVNPRVSRSSALASKATGYPIAKVASKIAIGYTLDEIENTVTGKTYACNEPVVDYCVIKFPRWPFDKFVYADRTLGTQMKATGEVMSIGVYFEDALMKAIRGTETKVYHIKTPSITALSDEDLIDRISVIDDLRIFTIAEIIRRDLLSVDDIFKKTMIDRWFLNAIKNITDMEKQLSNCDEVTQELYLSAKRLGFLDQTICEFSGKDIDNVKRFPVYKKVDTCAAEFEADTPYYYSTYDQSTEVLSDNESSKKKILVLGSGPIRIGQGIEFDYCSVHCVWSLKKLGYETIIINNNPETVSTDFDTADRLYFEPLTKEDISAVINSEKPDGVIIQFGGQTAINLANHIESLGVRVFGTRVSSIDESEDREKFDNILKKCDISRPQGGTAFTIDEALEIANMIKYPVLVRPSYVLGGQGMEIAYCDEDIVEFMSIINRTHQENPVLIDKYMMGREIEVDAICDGHDILIPGIMEHLERAGVHSGDSISVYPCLTLSNKHKGVILEYTKRLAQSLKIIGVVNIQFILFNDNIFVIEVNPRSSRTVPYISKVTGVPMIDFAVRCMFGQRLSDMGYGIDMYPEGKNFAVKVPVFSFQKLTNLDTQLGPEMKSTGETLGISKDFRQALLKGLLGAGFKLTQKGKVMISVKDSDKQEAISIAERFEALGFEVYATSGTANVLNRNMVAANAVRNIDEPSPNIVDMIDGGGIDYVISTSVKGRRPELGSVRIRRTAVERLIPCLTSMDTASALLQCLEGDIDVSNMNIIDINTL